MWRLAKTDFLYNRTLFACIYGIILIGAAANAVVRGLENLLMIMMFFSIVAIGAVTGNEEAKYNMKRFLIRLPVPLRQIALGGHMLWFLYWLSLILIFWVSCLIGRHGGLGLDFLWLCLALTGSANGLVFGMGLGVDSTYDFTGKAGRFLLRAIALFFASISGSAYLFIARFPSDLDNTALAVFLKSPFGAVVLLSLASGAALLYFHQFIHRRSYTH